MIEARSAETRDRARHTLDLTLRTGLNDLFTCATPHALRSGDIVRADYIDFDVTVRDPARAREIASIFAKALSAIQRERHLDHLAFINKNDEEASNTIGALMLAALIAADREVWLPFVVVRLDKDIPHERVKLHMGPDSRHGAFDGLTFALITDHVSNGDEVLEAAGVIGSYGGKVSDIVTYSCRRDLFTAEADVRNQLKAWDIDFHAVYDFWFEQDAVGGPYMRRAMNEKFRELVLR